MEQDIFEDFLANNGIEYDGITIGTDCAIVVSSRILFIELDAYVLHMIVNETLYF